LFSKIATESGQQPFNANEILNHTIKGMALGKTLDKRELHIERLLALLANDKHTISLLTSHRKTFDDIRKIISNLELTGAGQIVKGHYVAVSSIAFLSPLREILKYWDGENFKIDNLDSYNSNIKMGAYLIQSFK
jgi:hypothetical protein